MIIYLLIQVFLSTLPKNAAISVTGAVQDSFLLVAGRPYLYKIDLDSDSAISLLTMPRPGLLAVAYDPVEMDIYWTDDEEGLIGKDNLNAIGQNSTIIFDNPTGQLTLDGLTLGTENRKLYYADAGDYPKIVEMNLDGSQPVSIVSKIGMQPRALVLDSKERYLYYTDWGVESGIYVVDLSTHQDTAVLNDGLVWPNALAIDFGDSVMYWADAYLLHIEMANLDGSGRVILVNDVNSNYYAMALSSQYLYITDWKHNAVKRLDRRTSDMSDQMPTVLGELFGIVYYSSNIAKGPECQSNVKNIAVREGEPNTIMNLYIDPLNVTWAVIPTSDEFGSYTIMKNGGYRDPTLTGLYDVNRTGLIIKNATTTEDENRISTAGLYTGQCVSNADSIGAKLLVVRSGPQCSCAPMNSTASNVSCEVTFADSFINPIYPIVTWKLNGVFLASYTLPRTKIDAYVFYAVSTITGSSDTYDNYECELTFDAPTDIELTYVATNAPEFNEYCSITACPITTTLPPTTTTLPRTATTLPPTLTILSASTTTQSPTTTTLAPTTTTLSPSTTTESSTMTTLPPSTTIQPPTTTTLLPSTTTLPTITTTLQPSTTTQKPTTTTLTTLTPRTTTLPSTTTTLPRITTTLPPTTTILSTSTTPQSPTTTTLAPTTTTLQPSTTTQSPTTTTLPPTTTTLSPSTTTQPLSTTILSPSRTIQPPTTTTLLPSATTQPPTTTTLPSTTTLIQPTTTTLPPITTVPLTSTTTQPPTTATMPPTTTTLSPSTTTESSTMTTLSPATTIQPPTAITLLPSTTTLPTTKTTLQPSTTTQKPTTTTLPPTTTILSTSTTTQSPTTTTQSPTTTTLTPTTTTPQPSTKTQSPTTTTLPPTTTTLSPSTTTQPSTTTILSPSTTIQPPTTTTLLPSTTTQPPIRTTLPPTTTVPATSTTTQPPITTTLPPTTTTLPSRTTILSPSVTIEPPITTILSWSPTIRPPTTTTLLPSTTTLPTTTTTLQPSTTTQKPTTTTQPPTTTTLPPTTTIPPPTTTTFSPSTTTQPPTTTKLSPSTTTQPPTSTLLVLTTILSRLTTTQPHTTTTLPPIPTTLSQSTTTKPPTTTSLPPATTTQPLTTNTLPPTTISLSPSTITQTTTATAISSPETTQTQTTTTLPPTTTTTTLQSSATTLPPTTTTLSPATTTLPPTTTIMSLKTTTLLPLTSTQPPITFTPPPSTTTQPPTTTTITPTTTTPPIATTTQPPTRIASSPTTTTQPSTTTTLQPSRTTKSPTATTLKPTTTTLLPSTTIQPPTRTTLQPSTTTLPPLRTTKRPSMTTQAPSTTTHPLSTTTLPPLTTNALPAFTSSTPPTSITPAIETSTPLTTIAAISTTPTNDPSTTTTSSATTSTNTTITTTIHGTIKPTSTVAAPGTSSPTSATATQGTETQKRTSTVSTPGISQQTVTTSTTSQPISTRKTSDSVTSQIPTSIHKTLVTTHINTISTKHVASQSGAEPATSLVRSSTTYITSEPAETARNSESFPEKTTFIAPHETTAASATTGNMTISTSLFWTSNVSNQATSAADSEVQSPHRSTIAQSTPTPEFDPCSSIACLNGGTCYNGTCRCAPGYTNTSCEIEINECESQPCYPFGNCTDLVADYNCTCLPGFYSDNSSNQICHEVDECQTFLETNENPVCYHDGKCQDDINRFFCVDCDGGENVYFTDNRCKNITYAFPLINGITRHTGPVAGGTLVTFIGTGLDIIPVLGAYFNDSEGELPELMGYLLNGSVQSSNSFVVVTSKANDSYSGRNLTLTVLFNGGVLFSLQDSVIFQYAGNPLITDIQPREIPICGGVRLTVMGNSLDIVSTAIMLLTLETKYPNGTVTTNSTSQLCNSQETNSTQMICQLPVFDLPDEVAHAIVEASSNSSTDGTRNKRHAPQQPVSHHRSNLHSVLINSINGLHPSTLSRLISPPTYLSRNERHLHRSRRNATASISAGNSSVKLYVGFLLDNYPKYENVSKVLPNVTIKMTLQLPRISPNGDRDYSEDPLPIKGQNMTSGCTKDDYSVFVGNGTCVVISLTDNQLLCILPLEKPLTVDNANAKSIKGRCSDDHLPVMVKVSNSSYHAWCIRYGPPQPPWVIWTSVGAGILFLIIALGATIAVAVCLQRRRKRRRRGLSIDDRDSRGQDGVGRIQKRRQLHRRELGGAVAASSDEGVDWNLAPFGGPLSGQNSYTSRIDGTIASAGRHTIDHLDGSGRARFEYDRRIGSVNSGISSATDRYDNNLRTILENAGANQDQFVKKPFGYLVRQGKRIRYTTPIPSEMPEENGVDEREQRDGRDSTVRSQNWYFANSFGRLRRPFERVDNGRVTEPMRKAIRDHPIGTGRVNSFGGSMIDQRLENEGEISRPTTPEPDYDARDADIEWRSDRLTRRNEVSGDYSRTMESKLNSVNGDELVNDIGGPSTRSSGLGTSALGVSKGRESSYEGPGNQFISDSQREHSNQTHQSRYRGSMFKQGGVTEEQDTPKGFNFALLGGLKRSKRLNLNSSVAEDTNLADPPATGTNAGTNYDHLSAV